MNESFYIEKNGAEEKIYSLAGRLQKLIEHNLFSEAGKEPTVRFSNELHLDALIDISQLILMYGIVIRSIQNIQAEREVWKQKPADGLIKLSNGTANSEGKQS